MAKISSTNILIYPTAYRGKIDIIEENKTKLYNPESVLNTERNITRNSVILPDYISNQREGFVISDEYASNKDFEFVLYGYYFKIKSGSLSLDNSWNNVYVHIYTAELWEEWSVQNTNYTGTSLINIDSYNFEHSNNPVSNQVLDDVSGNFCGLEYNNISTKKTNISSKEYILHILTKNSSGNWVIPEDSKLKYSAKSIYSDDTNKNILNYFKMNGGNIVLDAEAKKIELTDSNNLFQVNTDKGLYVKNSKASIIQSNDAILELNNNIASLTNGSSRAEIKLNSDGHIDVTAGSNSYINLNSILNVKDNINLTSSKKVNFETGDGDNTLTIYSPSSDSLKLYDSTSADDIFQISRNNLNLNTYIISLYKPVSYKKNNSTLVSLSDNGIQTNRLFISGISTPTVNEYNSLVINSTTNEVMSRNLSGTFGLAAGTPTLPDEAGFETNKATIYYVQGGTQHADGQVTSIACAVQFDGTDAYQGNFRINTPFGGASHTPTQIQVAGLQTNCTPTFAGLNLTGNLSITNSSSSSYANIRMSNGSSNYNPQILFQNKDYNNSIQLGDTSQLHGYISLWNSSARSKYIILDAADGKVEAKYFNATSDRRLKENIQYYNPDKSILDLNVYKYDFIDGKKGQIGCMAQELQEICPEIVSKDENGYLSIQETKLIYLLLDEVKKLKIKLEKIKQE